ncbi:MAG: hypothetical protein KGH57_00310 [Candidatus Micrarchaeota archaeon]|nr:hypothetical protein [Candidatus Micrarchaeota archaeon]
MAKTARKRGAKSYEEKEQVSIEEITALAFGVAIAIVASFLLLHALSGIGNAIPSRCTFSLGINCSDFVIASNSTSTEFAMLGTNSQEFPINAVSLTVTLNGKSATARCTKGKIRPGQVFVCFGNLGAFQQSGYQVVGNATASFEYCGFNGGDCGSGVSESYSGAYVSTTGRFVKPQIGIMLFAPIKEPNGSYEINSSFEVFGYAQELGTITLTPQSGAPPAISYSGPQASLLNVSVNTLADYCAGIVNVTYSNFTSTGVVALNTSNYTGSSFSLSGNSGSQCKLLSSGTTSVSVSGKSNTAGLFTLSNVFINVSSTGSQNNLAVFNSTATLKIAGNNNNVTMYNSDVVLDITGTYNQVKFVNSRISNLTASGNNNLIVLVNTTVSKETVTGTNDIIQSS